MWACASCNANIQPRYNPFSNLALDENSDKFYDDEGAYDDQVIQSISNVLENCKHYTIHDLNEMIRAHQQTQHPNTANP